MNVLEVVLNCSVIETPESGDAVYDFQVEDNENFFVCGVDGAPSTPLLVHNCWLKELEEPPKSTTWLIGSMDPEKFASTQNGRAIANRCLQFHLKPYTDEELLLQAKRIIKGEQMAFMGRAAAEAIVAGCNGEMRTLANMVQSAAQYYEGLEDKPDRLTADDVQVVIRNSTSDDDVTMVRFMTALYARKFGAAHRELLNVADGFQFISKALQANWYLTNNAILKGERHPKVWGSASASQLVKNLDTLLPASLATRVHLYGLVQTNLTKLKAESQAFAVPELMALSAFAFQTIEALKAALPSKQQE